MKDFIVLSVAAANFFMLKNAIEITGDNPWLKIGISGKWEGHPVGAFELNQATFDQMVGNFEKSAVDIVCDYEHQTLYGDQAPASGWIKKNPLSLKAENGELFAKIEWTDKATTYIKNIEYRYLSPVFAPNTIDQATGANIGWTLHSVALTNKPFLQELDEVRLNKLNNQTKEETMTQEEKDAMTALQAENTSLKADKEKLTAEVLANKEASAMAKVDAAIAAKKIHPDQKEHALKMCKADMDGFDKFMETAKPFVTAPGGNDLFDNKQTGATGNQLSQAEIKAATGGAL
ncbi:phage protease [Sulfurospirillum cavolei]|uniref:phage protease n=1 Tax=Sulfurospirillum cavolei TaxID=366522 RepID=UPI000764A24A|nr:phage protease [Sulfurospirillum cavolei]